MATVMIIGDTHAPCMRKGYIGFLQRTADKYQPDQFVHIGDLVDNCAYSMHEKLPELKNPIQERKNTKRQIQRLTDAFPVADLLIGNHDALIERRALQNGLDPETLKPFEQYWNLPQEWTVHKRYHTLVIDGVSYFHGDKYGAGMYAHLHNAKNLFTNVVQGHLHANFGVMYHANQNDCVFGMCVGCGIDWSKLAMEYGVKFAKKPILGCGIVIDGVDAIPVRWKLNSVHNG